jgi:glycosyltransferase involved in cell wall biosynthesis
LTVIMHLLWISDSPETPSGFGNVTRFVCAGLARLGHRVSILGWQTREPVDWNGCRLYATGRDPMGSDALFAYLVRHRPDVVVALADVWWLPFFTSPHVRRQMELTGTSWLLYFPIDGDTKTEDLPPSWVQLLREVDVPVAMSVYGQGVAKRSGVPCEYIPHGVDLEVFSPPADREAAKTRVGATGRFLILSDSRNQPRKCLPRLLEIFARFAAGRPDALLHLHTDPDDEFARSQFYSYDLRADVRHLGIEGQVRFSPGFSIQEGGGLPLSELAAYYQAADVHLLASSGEGFGLPTLQAAAAGAVPMAGAYSASLELVAGHGASISIAEWGETEFGIRRGMISVDDAVEKLVHYYDDRALLREHSLKARQFALSYSWDEVVARWDRLLRSFFEARRRGGRHSFRSTKAEELIVSCEEHSARNTRGSNRNAASAPKHVQSALPSLPGVSVSVKMVQHDFGRLEAAIAADVRQQSADVRIPAVPPDCEVARVRVPRRPGSVGMASGDTQLFAGLKRLFPVLSGWVPMFALRREEEGLRFLPLSQPADARYELAQSVLLLNVSGELPESLLVDCALYGVPCVGSPEMVAQQNLWPELATADPETALTLARELLANPARIHRISAAARQACVRIYAPSAEDAAAWLRRLHGDQRLVVAAGGAK